ncbi:MAG: hypothetical protein AAGA05_01765 [Pseudomonadota bacterium]
MERVDRFPATGFFRGTRTIMVRSLPEGARLLSFRLRIIPVANDASVGPAIETVTFPVFGSAGTVIGTDPDDPNRETGITRVQGGGTLPWSEIQFGGFRTLASVAGSNFAGKVLQVDLGGLFTDVGDTGTVPARNGVFTLGSGTEQDLPGLTVQRLRLSATVASPQPVITELSLRSVASNLTLSIGRQPAAWAMPGEIVTAVETTDLTEFAQAALDEAEVAGGFALLPLHLKTDTTARLAIEVIMDVQEHASGLPAGLRESTLDYAHDGTPEAGDDILQISVPPGMEVDPTGTRIEIDGTFEGSEISLGSVADRTPQGEIALPVGNAAAQPVTISSETVLDAVDVLLSTQARSAEVKIDLRADFDSKPGDISLLSQPATGTLGVSAHGGPRWLSVALGQTVTLPPETVRLWLVVEVVSEPVAWHVNAEAGGAAEMQTSDNGGLSWRAARAASPDGSLAAQFRLRRASPVFRVPVSAEIGRDDEANILALDRFQPLGRVEFTLDAQSVTEAVNGILSERAAAACPRGEQLINGGFSDRDEGELYRPGNWSVSGGDVSRQFLSVDGLDGQSVTVVQVGSRDGGPRSLSQIIPVSPDCTYSVTFRGFVIEPGAVIELIWRVADCGLYRTDTLEPPPFAGSITVDTAASTTAGVRLQAILSRSMTVTAPPDAEQLEIRMRAPAGQRLFVDAVSLVGGPVGLRNPDFTELDPLGEGADVIEGWTVHPPLTDESPPLSAEIGIDGLSLTNTDAERRVVMLSQQVSVTPGAPFAAALEARPIAGQAGFAVRWLSRDGAEIGTPLAAPLVDDGTDITRLRGQVPDGAAMAEIQIQLSAGAGATLIAAVAEVEAPETIPVSFLAEAPGRMTVRDFTVAFRPRLPAPLPQLPDATPCLPTPADAAPADFCECDPCCDKTSQSMPTAIVDIVVPPVERPQGTIVANPAALPQLSLAARLPEASATARILSRVREASFLRAPNRLVTRATLGRVAREAALARANTPVVEINGIGDRREELLAEIGITSVGSIVALSVDELAEILDIRPELSRNLLSQAQVILRGSPETRSG